LHSRLSAWRISAHQQTGSNRTGYAASHRSGNLDVADSILKIPNLCFCDQWYHPHSQMHLSLVENILWAFGTALKVLLCILVFYRHLYRRLPFFSIYVALLIAEVGVVWSAYRVWAYGSRFAWYVYWYSVGALLLARGSVVAELCAASLRNYPAIWSLVRNLLLFVAVVVLACAVIAAYQNKTPVSAFVLTAERGLEISILIILVAMLGFGVSYDVALCPLERNIVLGLGVYSTFQVLNDSFVDQWMTPHFHWWNSARVIAFDAALLLWLVPLRKPLPAPAHPHVLLNEEVARHLLRQLLARMREVIEELKRLSKSGRK
jgi:hypothetical protein